MNDISPAAKAARDAARRANGEFGNQQHSEPEPWGARVVDGWSAEQAAAVRYTPPARLAGYRPDEDHLIHLYTGMVWAHRGGEQPGDLAAVRRYAGQMSDDDFLDLYGRAARQAERDNAWNGFKEWAEDAATATASGGGAIADDYLADAGIGDEGYMGGTAFRGHLADVVAGESGTQIAERIRDDIRAAKDAGYLPGGIRVSVRQQRGSMMNGYDVHAAIPDELTHLPGTLPWNEPDWQTSAADGHGSPFHPEDHPVRAEIERRLTVVANRYAAYDKNPMVDFHQSSNESRVTVDTDDHEAQSERYRTANEHLRRWRERQRLGRE